MPLYKQPLLHFLLMGGLVFIISSWLYPQKEDGLTVDRSSFLEFLQYRNKTGGSSSAEQLLAGLSDEKKQTLWNKHLEEEVLYREAIKLGLDKKDYVIKQRLIQKMDYLLEETDGEKISLDQIELEAYYLRNAERYYSPARLTFTHIFFKGFQDDAQLRAQQIKPQLNQEQVPFEQAARFGDRFIYYTNYIERDLEFIASHFGRDFAAQIAALTPSNFDWLGPLRSDHGWHLMKLVSHQKGETPLLEDIHERVMEDARSEKRQLQRNIKVQELARNYGLSQSHLKAVD